METTTIKKNVYEIVTERVINALESGTCPWHRPWIDAKTGQLAFARRWSNGKPYGLLNQLFLPAGEYITYKKLTEAGGRLKKGSKTYQLYESFLSTTKETITDEEGKETEVSKSRWSFRFYGVYRVEDCTGLPEKPVEHAEELTEPEIDELMKEADNLIDMFVSQEGIEFRKGSNDACYIPSKDMICVPALKQYKVPAEYYSTTFHEMTHSTGSDKRLDRKGITSSDGFGHDRYAQEELVAEMGAAMLMAKQGIDSSEAFDNSAAYLKGWVKRFRDDKKMIVIAAQQAEKAAEYILNRKTV